VAGDAERRSAAGALHSWLAGIASDINDDILVPLNSRWINMRTTLALDDELLAQAQSYTGIREKSALVREALRALIEREAARRLARLGGSELGLAAIPRRRTRRG
jgi:Arc/MetJ family transcription regulator